MSTSNLIVLELLSSTFDNYEDWKVTMQSYLKGEGLWGIIQENETDGMTQEMNAKALHAIQISCAPEILSLIKEIESAKEAWEFLEKEYNMNWGYINTYIETQNKLKEQEDVGKHIYLHTSLYIAALNGDWESAKQVLDRDRDAVHVPLSKNKNTVLHLAVSTASTKFVRNLITNYMSKEDLKQKNFFGSTALHFAAAWGRLDMVKLLLDNNPGLLTIRCDDSSTALTEAIRYNHKHVSSFLYYESATHQTPPPEDGIHLIYSIVAGNYGLALDITRRLPRLSTNDPQLKSLLENALLSLTGRHQDFISGARLGFWERQIYHWIHVGSRSISGNEADEQHNGSPQGIYFVIMTRVLQSVEQLLLKIPQVLDVKKLRDMKIKHKQAPRLLKELFSRVLELNDHFKIEESLGPSLVCAAENGIIEFFIEALHSYPLLLRYRDNDMSSLQRIAITNRQENIFRFFKKLPTWDGEGLLVDASMNTMLHLVGELAPSNRLNLIPGAALQMQRELQWFVEVEKMVPPYFREKENSEGMTAYKLFRQKHKELVSEGEKWMKETAASCTIVATLVITIMFAAAFTVPGGNKESEGVPLLLRTKSFMVFVISDALSLFSSTTSVLMFLSILTSRYTEEAFLESLPRKLMLGLVTLFVSLAAMMAAFCATIFILLDGHLRWISIVLASFASFPVTMFLLLQLPLFVDMVHSTYFSNIFE